MNAYTSAAFNQERLQREIADPASGFYFCLYENDVIGYMKLNFAPSQSDLNDPESLELERIYILQEHQNKKAGQFMIEQAVSIASKHNLKYIWLGVWEHNAGAIKFYERNGFQRTGEHSFMLGDEKQTDLIMKRAV
jgi:ribosomal protein S18 acetylase RimI-like enzyme